MKQSAKKQGRKIEMQDLHKYITYIQQSDIELANKAEELHAKEQTIAQLQTTVADLRRKLDLFIRS